MRQDLGIIPLVSLLFLGLGCWGSGEAARLSLEKTRIAFSSYRDGNHEIYVMNVDGSDQTRLTADPAHDVKPVWSPDGMRIAFQTTRHGLEEIYVMDADGHGQVDLTNNPAYDGFASWSPYIVDGQ